MYKKSSLLNFVCALIPGVGYMYNGLMKRGFEQLILFFGIMTILDYEFNRLKMALLVPIWFYNFFDTFNVKNAIDRGIDIDDNYRVLHKASSELNMNKFNNKILGITLIVIGVLSVLNKLGNILFSFRFIQQYYMIYSSIRQLIIPVLFIIVGLVLMRKSKEVEQQKAKKEDLDATIVLDFDKE